MRSAAHPLSARALSLPLYIYIFYFLLPLTFEVLNTYLESGLSFRVIYLCIYFKSQKKKNDYIHENFMLMKVRFYVKLI